MMEQLTKIQKIKGPFWTAQAEIIRLKKPIENRAWCTLFVDISQPPRDAFGQSNKKFLLAGTILALCFVSEVRIEPAGLGGPVYVWQQTGRTPPDNPTFDQIEAFVRSGELSLLLLAADPDKWPQQAQNGTYPDFTCVGGEIQLLDHFKPQNEAPKRLYEALTLKEDTPPAAFLSLHAGGLSVYGRIQLPWQNEEIIGYFQLVRHFHTPTDGQIAYKGFQLSPEIERFTDEQKASLITAWKRLSSHLSSFPQWVALEVANPNRAPHLFWGLHEWQENPPGSYPLHFGSADFNLYLTEGRLGNPDDPPTSIAQLRPQQVIITNAGSDITISVASHDAIATQIPVMSETFNSEPPDKKPTGWVNHKAWRRPAAAGGDIFQEDTEDSRYFTVFEFDGKRVLRSHSDESNIHAHCNIPGVLTWKNYTFTGRFYLTDADPPPPPGNEYAGIGITFLSHHPEGRDFYYRIRRFDEVTAQEIPNVEKGANFHLSAHHDTPRVFEGNIDSGVNPDRNTWYQFRVEVEDSGSRTHIRANIWPADEAEPLGFQIDAYDEADDRLSAGTVGVWAILGGEKYFDDLRVEPLMLETAVTPGLAFYAASQSTPSAWQETWTYANAQVTFHPIETARWLRTRQEIPSPTWDAQQPQAEPHLLWGFMPLADGWFQLPVPNLTEQIYLDAELVSDDENTTTAEPTTPQLQGALQIGATTKDEHPWRVTLTDAGEFRGTWHLDANLAITHISLTLHQPQFVTNGLLWLSGERPTEADALPELDNWINSLQSIPLYTVNDRHLYPPLVIFNLKSLSFSTSDEQEAIKLRDYRFNCRIDQDKVAALQKGDQPGEAGVWPEDKDPFTDTPLVWQRHPTLPMIQAVPLTQSKSPPNHPSRSRQYVPFALNVANPTWEIGTDRGATNWPRALTPLAPAANWYNQGDLPLASLSLPGLVLLPTVDESAPTFALTRQYRYDLPVTDEINALAQLPRNEEETAVSSPPQPLHRPQFAIHWQKLAERAALAAIDAAIAWDKDKTHVQSLIEPHQWSVTIRIDEETYPGQITLIDSHDNTQKIELTTNKALEGISGSFAADENNIHLKDLPDNGSFHIQAGSMSAHHTADGIRDQRGLIRSAAQLTANFIQTKLQLDSETYQLTSAQQPISLAVADRTWQIWFRDLPMQAGKFDRTVTYPEGYKEKYDVNNPEAKGRAYNHLSGYEWHLIHIDAPHFLINGLEFFPLTLEAVEIVADKVSRLAIVGRLQLPVESGRELVELSNAVRLHFEVHNDQLRLENMNAEPGGGEWPLRLANGEQTNAPLIQWDSIRWQPEEKVVVVENAALKFSLFDQIWSIPLDNGLGFAQLPPGEPQTYSLPGEGALHATQASLQLDPFLHKYEACLTIQTRFGDLQRPSCTADIRFSLLNPEETPVVKKLVLFSTLTISNPITITYQANGLQMAWEKCDDTEISLLPGIPINTENTPGYFALTFAATPSDPDIGIPDLNIATAFLETLLHCQWGQRLPQTNPVTAPQLFSSAAGNLACAYTSQYQSGGWQDSFILNGLIELRNLISWPAEIPYDVDTSTITLPPPGSTDTIRHVIRILLNQHEIPTAVIKTGTDPYLLTLTPGKVWQFLALVEHHLFQIAAVDDTFTEFTKSNEIQWAAVQEVRLLAPDALKKFLNLSQNHVPDPAKTIYLQNEQFLHGYLNESFVNAVLETDLPPDTLLVEAGAPHWFGKTAVDTTLSTTLQFLPQSIQLASLSQPDDYTAPSEWALSLTPFLGRLQPAKHDGLNPDNWQTKTALQIDPILRLHRTQQQADPLPQISLSLASLGDHTEIQISPFDNPIAHRWPRLSAISLTESWFRLRHSALETPDPNRLHAVMVSYTDSPSQMSRSLALQRAFNPKRTHYPPAQSTPEALTAESDQITWRPDSLMIWQAVNFIGNNPTHHPWCLVGLQFIDFLSTAAQSPAYHIAATLLPTPLANNPIPQTLTVSPYTTFDTVTIPAAELTPVLISGELLCIEPGSKQLRAIASLLLDHIPENNFSNYAGFDKWARETHKRLAPQSPIAILRLRQIKKSTPSPEQLETFVTVDYVFRIVSEIDVERPLTRRVFPLRSTIQNLRYREAQFGGKMPLPSLNPLEIAPPQVAGVQPVYITDPLPAKWPWGLSALRLSVQYQQGKTGTILSDKLWWQAPQQTLQYRSALNGQGATAGLPRLFRTTAVRSLLPVISAPILPDYPATDAEWSPVLPGALSYFFIGGRSGAIFAMRNLLMRQSPDNQIILSGSVPVQHRTPRPPTLLPNQPGQQANALQTWGHYFAPKQTLIAADTPMDEAFVELPDGAATGLRATWTLSIDGIPTPGTLPPHWDGKIPLQITYFANNTANGWIIDEACLIDGTTIYPLTKTLTDDQLTLKAPFNSGADDNLAAATWLASKATGAPLSLQLVVHHAAVADGFSQTLTLPLRVGGSQALPLKPTYIQFEDPEHNRCLISAGKQATKEFFFKKEGENEKLFYALTLSTDRQQYNAHSALYVRYDWQTAALTNKANLKFIHIRGSANNDLTGKIPNGALNVGINLSALVPGQLVRLSLAQLMLQAGDSLELHLSGFIPGENAVLSLKVDIIDEPVEPVPQAAYALLCKGENYVECARFAWQPIPSRTELINPEDLITGTIRRRAVFKWQHVVRSALQVDYAIQKTTLQGATHFPVFAPQDE